MFRRISYLIAITLISSSNLLADSSPQIPVKEGPYKSYYPNGKLKQTGIFHQNKADGLIEEWHENGKKKFEATYKDGKPHGEWKEFSLGGQLIEKGQMDDGEQDGDWHYWYPMGGYRTCKRFNKKNFKKHREFVAFSVAPTAVFQKAGHQTFTVMPSWSPGVRFSRFFLLMANFGAMPLKSGLTSNIFPGLEYQFIGSFSFFPQKAFSFEFGGGAQTWIHRGTSAMASAGFSIRFTSSDCTDGIWLRRLDRIYFMASSLFIPNTPTGELRVGTRFVF